jgi:hypothetical protein
MIDVMVATVSAMADCERIHDGLLSEPLNTLSSLTYVAAGAWVWRHNRLHGTALVAVGVGSVAYHGPGGSGARWLHDATIVLLAAVVAVAAQRIARGVRAQPGVALCAAGALALALPLQLFGRSGGPLCRPNAILQAHAGWHVLSATALAGAFVLAAAGGRARHARHPTTSGAAAAGAHRPRR